MSTTISVVAGDAFVNSDIGLFGRPVQSGSTISTIAALKDLDSTHTYLGALLASGATEITLPGAPTRDSLQAAVDGGTEEIAIYTASTDAATIKGTSLELRNRDFWEYATGKTFGATDYIDGTGGVPAHVEIVAVALDEAGEPFAVVFPYALGFVSGGLTLNVGGADGAVKPEATWNGDPHPSITGDDGKPLKYRILVPEGSDES